jgi:hypothetical protein
MLPNTLNELEFITTYKIRQMDKTSHFYVYKNILIEFKWLKDLGEYLITIYECKNNNIDDIHSVKDLKYDEYKYETEDIHALIKKENKIIYEADEAKNYIITKYNYSLRKEKIKKLLQI